MLTGCLGSLLQQQQRRRTARRVTTTGCADSFLLSSQFARLILAAIAPKKPAVSDSRVQLVLCHCGPRRLEVPRRRCCLSGDCATGGEARGGAEGAVSAAGDRFMRLIEMEHREPPSGGVCRGPSSGQEKPPSQGL